ncbi:MAG TPA: HEAT repeat domain-containing protein [Gemmatimonadaceae bacterium]|nr:HEAT repeat domain-containing protein [Gemmatimonadaceae bacterium]
MIRPLRALVLLAASASLVHAQRRRSLPLDSGAVGDIARLLLLEDVRRFDSLELSSALQSKHPEVRRRAMLAVARINDKRGVALLRARPLDADTALAATMVFAVGQLRDTLTIAWFDSLLSNPRTAPTVATEAACALGKIKTAAARAVLARYLTNVTAGPRTRDAIGEALLAIGRSTARGDIAPIVKWTSSPDEEIRWRATWAIFRPRDPAAVGDLLRLSDDRSGHVRSWAVRGLVKSQADSASVGERAEAKLLAALRDTDRRVRSEAIRALGSYSDSLALTALTNGLSSADSWISVSAAEGLGRSRLSSVVPALVAATDATRPCALRATAIRQLQPFANAEARTAASALARDTVPYCQNLAAQILRDTANAGRGGAGGGRGRQPQQLVERPMSEYRAIVERWIVPSYNGKPLPRARMRTVRGDIELELYAGDAPLAMHAMTRILDGGNIVGSEFSRVVPDFVDQEATIRDAAVQRDEVNRHRLTRGNLAWASAGLDTGRPGYTLNHTPQPHNEGDFTSLGRVIRGQDVVDRIELGDRILGLQIITNTAK